MKKILFILGVLFSAYGFAMSDIVIDESVTYQELSKKVELVKAGPNDYDLELTPVSLFGVKMDDLDIDYITLSFDDTSNINIISIFLGRKNNFKVVLNRFKNTFAKNVKIDVLGKEHYTLMDSKKFVRILKGDNSFSIIIRLNNKGCLAD